MCLRPLTPAEGQNRVAEANQLRDRVQDGATPADREAGLTGIVQFVEAVGRPAEPFVVPLMPAILKALSEKVCASFQCSRPFVRRRSPCMGWREDCASGV